MRLNLLICIAVFLLTAGTAAAQTERVDSLRLQLEELKSKQADLESRLQILEEQSKPENIEKSLAGVGSTKPEDLRELKRRQFESEKAGVQKQLAILTESRTRLEAGLAQAEATAYQESAKGPAAVTETKPVIVPQEKPRKVKVKRTRKRRASE